MLKIFLNLCLLICWYFANSLSKKSEMHEMAVIDNLEYVKPGRKLLRDPTFYFMDFFVPSAAWIL
jgi:hypothetical protein